MLPEGFSLSDDLKQWATERALPPAHVAAQFEAFVDDARSKSRRYADWAAAFRNWLRKAADFDRSAPRPAHVGSLHREGEPERRCYWRGMDGSEQQCVETKGLIRIGPTTCVCVAHQVEHYEREKGRSKAHA